MLALRIPLSPSGSQVSLDEVACSRADRDERVVAPVCPEGARLVPLTRGYFAIVDEADAPAVSGRSWYAFHVSGKLYARAASTVAEIEGGAPTQVFLHRFIMKPARGVSLDHANGNGLDCRRRNLRACRHSENCWNRPKAASQRTPSSIWKGVSRGKNVARWRARIKKDAAVHHLGVFDTEIEAARAYDTAAKQFFGRFAKLNFPEGEGASVLHEAIIGESHAQIHANERRQDV